MPRPRTNANPPVRDAMFARRLQMACSQNSKVPQFGQGQQTFIKDALEVSPEGVRKWFAGESRPRPDKMKALAKLLEVDEAWLSLGIKADADPKARLARNAMADGAVNVVAGLVQMNGGSPAFPADNDPRAEFVDLYAIIKGVQYAIHVSLAQEERDGSYRFRLPPQSTDCAVVGVVPVGPVRLILLNLRPSIIEANGRRRGGFIELVVTKDGNEYASGRDRVPRITSLSEKL